MGPLPQPDGENDRPLHGESSDIEDAEHPDVFINAAVTDSDTDEEEEGGVDYMGYQALGQDLNTFESGDEDQQSDGESHVHNVPNQSMVQSSGENSIVPEARQLPMRYPDFPDTENLPRYLQAPELPRPERRELLWNQPRNSDTKLDTGQADKIKRVMSGIQLPATNIPDWAKDLSEDQWQKQVVNRLVKSETSQQQEMTNNNNQSVIEASQQQQVTKDSNQSVTTEKNQSVIKSNQL